MEKEKLGYLVECAEQILAELDVQNPEYLKIKASIEFCRSWIDGSSVDEEQIYEFLDDEDEDDLVGYYIAAASPKDKTELGIILGVVSCISTAVLEENKSPIPQFLGGVDEQYYEAVLRDIQEYKNSFSFE